ncbi:ATP-dependent helicase [Paenibacillus sp. M1]|uniref:DNA 3'-5' helicase n=1 Tax=Paenibacillus haidiansis TaxID=1574488 RepID=A0ABU7VW56_9BACL
MIIEHTEFFTHKHQELGIALNEIQKQAVLQTEGPVLLLASPGSGKTTTIIMRIGYLIEGRGAQPSRIKAVTFSRAAANDMRERYKRFFPGLPAADFSTIHSLAYEIVREHFRKAGIRYQMIEGGGEPDPEDTAGGPIHGQGKIPLHKQAILRQIYKSLTGENITDDQMDELTTYISYVKNKMLSPEQWGAVKPGVREAETVLREYEAFKRAGQGSNQLLLDFDDMLTLGNEILERDGNLLAKYQRRYDYVLTDESQDTSLVQHAIIEKLVRGHGNLCVVADDDQSIYSWRGAEPGYLLNFRQTYPAAELLFMEQNYRSTPDIVNAANLFIRRNKHRYDKNMFTARTEREEIAIHSLDDNRQQTKYIVQELGKSDRLSEVAVLYRNNSSSVALINALDRAGIPFYMKDADNRFFSHWVVEDILNFMRMTFTDRRPDILEKIHLKMSGYISKQQMAELKAINNNESVFDNLLNNVKLQDYQYKLIEEARDTFREMRGMPPFQAISVIRGRLGYERALDKTSEWLGLRKEFLLGILNTLEEIADGLATMEEFADRLKTLESALKTSKKRRGEHAVTLSTFHSAKGLEFEKVYMIDLIDGIIPSSEDIKKHAAGEEAPMEEAVRLFYVGMTRAKRHLELVAYRERNGEKTAESRFVSHIRSIVAPEEEALPVAAGASFSPGDAVRHRVFGRGEVRGLHGDLIEISFSAGIKTLSLHTCLEMGLLTGD